MSAQPPKRSYDSTRRRLRAAETGVRIVTAACELLQGSPIRDWRGITIRSVAERAGISERTVYRHFSTEGALRDAVMRRLEQGTGIDLDHLALDTVSEVAGRVFGYVSKHPTEPRPPLDPTLDAAGRRQRDALRAAVDAAASEWPEADRVLAAAVFDVLWAVGAYERLVVDWDLDRDEAARGLTWAIDVVAEAIRSGRRPASGRP